VRNHVIALTLDKTLGKNARRFEVPCREFKLEGVIQDFFVARILGECALSLSRSARATWPAR
jgi:hypothetical protein